MDLITQAGPIPTLIAAAIVITLIGWMVTKLENTIILWLSGAVLVVALGIYIMEVTAKVSFAGMDPRQISYVAAGTAALCAQIFVHRLIKGTIESWLWALALSLAVAAGIVYGLMFGLHRI
jgi:hypothetical protein